ncbi:hypothetical protein VR010_09505 [Actinomycetaceae bacterium L2_0104]
MSEEIQPIRDDRSSTHGWPRILLWALALGAAIFTWRGIVASTQAFVDGDVSAAVITLISDLCWIAGSVGIIHNGRKMRRLAGVTWTINAVVPLIALFVHAESLVPVSPWYQAGSTYFFLPTLGAVAALVWLVWSAPSQIATRNGG